MNNSWKDNNLLFTLREETESFSKLNQTEKNRYIKLINDLDQFSRKMKIDRELKKVLIYTRDEIKKKTLFKYSSSC